MSQTDIYKNKEQVQSTSDGSQSRKGRRKHRTSTPRTFDNHDRKRRSKNSGLRRFLHLFRKSENERAIWWGLLIVVVILLLLSAIWQFGYIEYVARQQSIENELFAEPVENIPKADDSAVE